MSLRDKILDAAYELFASKGYDKTSVAEIIKLAGASKGGFYHHFTSKEEILETITFGYIEQVKKMYDEVLNNSLKIEEKFIESFYQLNSMKLEQVKDWDKIKNLYAFKDNHVLLRKMGEAFEKETMRYYQQLIQRGVDEGRFFTDYPQELAALWGREVIKFQQMSRWVLMDRLDQETFFRTLRFNEQLINKQLGLKDKTIELEKMGKKHLQAMKREIGDKRM